MRLSWMLAGVLALGAVPQIGVSSLIAQLEAPDPPTVIAAATELKARGVEVVPALLKSLHDNQSCTSQMQVAIVLHDIQPDSPLPNQTMVSIIHSKCKTKPQVQAAFRRQAGFALASRIDGIPTILEMLQGSDSAYRHAAAVAFIDTMESFSSGKSTIELTPALVDAEKTAFDALGKALKDSDMSVRCSAFDALTSAQKVPSDALKQYAAQVVNAVAKPQCPAK